MFIAQVKLSNKPVFFLHCWEFLFAATAKFSVRPVPGDMGRALPRDWGSSRSGLVLLHRCKHAHTRVQLPDSGCMEGTHMNEKTRSNTQASLSTWFIKAAGQRPVWGRKACQTQQSHRCKRFGKAERFSSVHVPGGSSFVSACSRRSALMQVPGCPPPSSKSAARFYLRTGGP